METKHTHFRDHIMFYILVPLIIIVSAVSFYRFIIKGNYVVSYQGSCDPTTEKCFVGCEDDACMKESYYTKVQKYAPDLSAECGKDITDCESANVCLSNDRNCSITYCDTETDNNICSTNSIKEDILQDNNINK